MKKIIILCFATLLFCITIFTLNSQAQPPNPSCMGDTTCNETYTYDSLVVEISDLCPLCSYTMYYWRRECFNPHRVDFQTSYGKLSNSCVSCGDWKELWKEGVKKIVLKEANSIQDTTFQMTFSNEACWKKINGIGPVGVGGYTVAPCNTECCKYTYQVIDSVVTLIQYEAPLSTCPPGDECFALCDPFGYFPLEKRSINELNFEDMEVYPNPVNSILNIKLNDLEKGNYEIRVSNVSGQTVMYTEQQNQSETMNINLDVNKLTKGTYYFTVAYKKKILKSGKFIVE